jgi:D-alanyl-lipoteichoic acid acyltransferase DltB (MBOAT superfamily)
MGAQWLVPLALLVPFMTPAAIANHLGWTIPLSWAIVIACCTGVAWLLAAVELWRRPNTSLAIALCVVWIALVVFGYCSLQQSIRDL